MAKQFGPVMTLWLGSIPQVFINDIELSREVFLSNNFAGRPKFSSKFFKLDMAKAVGQPKPPA